jgi:hypothetical protein
VVGVWRSSHRYQGRELEEEERLLIERMTELALQYGRYGYRRITALLGYEGWRVNHKRIEEKAEFHRKAIEGLNAEYLKLQKRIEQMYLDKLDGMVDEAFYIKHMKEWREDQKRLQRQIEAHQEADENYIEQGIRLIEIARNAYTFYQSKDQPKRAELVRFIFPNSSLRDSKVVPVFKPPFDIIWKMAHQARNY